MIGRDRACVNCGRKPNGVAGATGWTLILHSGDITDLRQSDTWCPSCHRVGVKRGLLDRRSPEESAAIADAMREALLGPEYQEAKRRAYLFGAEWCDWCKLFSRKTRRRAAYTREARKRVARATAKQETP